ncbi:MAG: hypothetical protein VB100_12885 [Angelakisella sp.]|nr:hypothetical protein [Angelakisella sp.]
MARLLEGTDLRADWLLADRPWAFFSILAAELSAAFIFWFTGDKPLQIE